jgi:POT family proton-dependent oligopeptide transporter
VQNTQISHPKSLNTFFTTEMWERYGFYVVQTLLAIYLVTHLGWHDLHVYELVGTFTALTYISPVLGGWIADHLIGQKRAILAGAFVLLLSYLAISIINSEKSLCLILAGIAVGTGLLKPNISSLLGNEYPENSPNRESGFTIFYIGLTIGIILGTTIPSFIKNKYGWPSAFLSAAIGMVFAIISFTYGIYRHKIADYNHIRFNMRKFSCAFLFIIALWIASYVILIFPKFADLIFLSVVILATIYFLTCIKKESKSQYKKTIVIGLLCIISIMFWAFYFQMFLSLTLFIIRAVEADLFGIAFPPPYYVGVQSVGMIILGLIIAKKRINVSVSERAIQTGNKFLTAMLCMTIAYGLIALVCHMNTPDKLISPLLLIPPYLIISLAELLLSPVGLSSISLLASRKRVSTMLGIFFVSLGLGGFLSGKLAAITALPDKNLSIDLIKIHYASSFNKLLVILLIATIFCIMLNYVIKRLMKSA